jgi:hypothetical protein
MTHVEATIVAEQLARIMEPHIQKIVTAVVEKTMADLFAHMGDELTRFSKLRGMDV